MFANAKNPWRYELIDGEVAVEIEIAYRGKSYFAYVDPDDFERICEWRWRLNKGRSTPYAVANIPGERGKKVWLHKLIANCIEPGACVDHINFNGLDNRRKNLRTTTKSLNGLHRRTALDRSKSGVRGVSWASERYQWRAAITVDGEFRHLGYFDRKRDAAGAVEHALRELGVETTVTPKEHRKAERMRRAAQEMGGARA